MVTWAEFSSKLRGACASARVSYWGDFHAVIKFRHIFSTLVTFGSMLLLSGCSHIAVLNPKGPVAADEKHLLFTAVGLMLIIVIPVIILSIVIARRYRASNTKAKYTPDWSHSNLLEAIWWSIPLVIIVILATITWISSHRLDPYRPLDVNAAEVKAKPVTIQVVSLDWRWLFIYPDQNIATINFVEFPANAQVTFLLTSDAPMNSFQIPQLAGQIYTMPGMQTKLHLLASEPGDYNGRSVSFSGDGFYKMTFIARATATQDEFDNWVKTVKQSPQKLTADAYNQLAAPSEDETVQYFSSVDNNLFNNIIMKFMMPSQDMQKMKSMPSNG
jgi:cytochrome o ubiquinol oxidase subunit 2